MFQADCWPKSGLRSPGRFTSKEAVATMIEAPHTSCGGGPANTSHTPQPNQSIRGCACTVLEQIAWIHREWRGLDDGDYIFCSASPPFKVPNWVIVNSTRTSGAWDFNTKPTKWQTLRSLSGLTLRRQRLLLILLRTAYLLSKYVPANLGSHD